MEVTESGAFNMGTKRGFYIYLSILFLVAAILFSFSCSYIELFFIDGKPYVSDSYGFSLKYPENWSVNDNGVMGSAVVFTDNESQERTKSNLNIYIREAEGLSLQQFVNKSKRGMEREIKSIAYKLLKFTDQSRVTLGKYEAYQHTYLFTQAGTQYKGRAYYYIENDKAYLLFCTADEKNFSKYENDFNIMVKSFRIN